MSSKSLSNMQEIVNSPIAKVACKSMQDRHAVRYLGSTFLRRAPRSPEYLCHKFNYGCLGHRCQASSYWWCATSSLVMLNDTGWCGVSCKRRRHNSQGISLSSALEDTSPLPLPVCLGQQLHDYQWHASQLYCHLNILQNKMWIAI